MRGITLLTMEDLVISLNNTQTTQLAWLVATLPHFLFPGRQKNLVYTTDYLLTLFGINKYG